MSDSLWPHGPQHSRLPCPSPSPGACSNSCPLSQWCHPTISSSAIPFSSCLQSFPASGSFLMSRLFASGGHSTGISASASVLPVNTQGWFPLGWIGKLYCISAICTVFNTCLIVSQLFAQYLILAFSVFSVMSDSLQPHGLEPAGFSLHGITRKEYLSRLPFPPPGILPAQGLNLHLPYSLRLQEDLFYHWATWEAHLIVIWPLVLCDSPKGYLSLWVMVCQPIGEQTLQCEFLSICFH